MFPRNERTIEEISDHERRKFAGQGALCKKKWKGKQLMGVRRRQKKAHIMEIQVNGGLFEKKIPINDVFAKNEDLFKRIWERRVKNVDFVDPLANKKNVMTRWRNPLRRVSQTYLLVKPEVCQRYLQKNSYIEVKCQVAFEDWEKDLDSLKKSTRNIIAWRQKGL